MSKHSECNLDDFIFNRFDTGFYVDVGANDGVHGSNTLTLEQRGWSGLCIEPLKRNIELLRQSRKCLIDESWLASSVRDVEILEQQTYSYVNISGHAAYGGSCIIDFIPEGHKKTLLSRRFLPKVVRTKTLNEVLSEYNIPRRVEFLKIDTEGSELDILMGCNLAKYSFGIISVEATLKDDKGLVDYLSQRGYNFLQSFGMNLLFENKDF